jgi:hypothetical protein
MYITDTASEIICIFFDTVHKIIIEKHEFINIDYM